MPRASGRFATFECLTCSAEFKGFWWYGNTDWATAANDKQLHELQDTSNGHTPECTLPHIRKKPSYSSNATVQVRESQRAVIYRFADGSWAQPGSNDPNDPVAVKSAREGGIREEVYHTRELHQFHKGMSAIRGAQFAGYNDVIDWDEHSRNQRDTETIEIAMLHDREQRGREALRQVSGGARQGRYEQIRKQHKDRR